MGDQLRLWHMGCTDMVGRAQGEEGERKGERPWKRKRHGSREDGKRKEEGRAAPFCLATTAPQLLYLHHRPHLWHPQSRTGQSRV